MWLHFINMIQDLFVSVYKPPSNCDITTHFDLILVVSHSDVFIGSLALLERGAQELGINIHFFCVRQKHKTDFDLIKHTKRKEGIALIDVCERT